jgi:hypothetical protein
VEAQHPRTGILCHESFAHDLRPHPPGCSEFGDLFEEVQPDNQMAKRSLMKSSPTLYDEKRPSPRYFER